jgi:MYXO-CTERM domain-containing protein
MKSLTLTLAVALTWLAPREAQACGATPPSYTLLTDDLGSVPVGTHVLKLYVYGSSLKPRPPSVKLSLDRLGNALPEIVPVTTRVKGEWLLEVDLGAASVQTNVEYILEVTGVEGESGNTGYKNTIKFQGRSAPALPSELGRLELRKRASGAIAYGGCGGSHEGEHALIALAPSAAAAPWLRAVTHQLVVDGKPLFEPEIPLIDYVARRSETVVRAIATCDRDHVGDAGSLFEPGIEVEVPAGKHTMQWQTTLPSGKVLETNTLGVDMRCGDGHSTFTAPTSNDAGQTSGSDAGTSGGAGGGRAVSQAPVLLDDAGQAQPSNDTYAAPEPDGCSLAHGSAKPWTPALVLALLGLATRLRRRRSRA